MPFLSSNRRNEEEEEEIEYENFSRRCNTCRWPLECRLGAIVNAVVELVNVRNRCNANIVFTVRVYEEEKKATRDE